MRTLSDRARLAVGALTLLSLLARLVALGARPFHWDEGRVGYWTLRFLDTGAYEYRPVQGGPFLYLVNEQVFTVLPPTDAVARLVVAAVGGLLPLAALLFRRPRTAAGDDATDRPIGATAETRSARATGLSDLETVALAFFLAATPPLLYYSRFLRADVPLAAFGLVAVGAAFRARWTGRRRYLYLAAAAFALALTTSAFVVVYLVVWLGAAFFTFDELRVRRAGAPAVIDRLRGYASGLRAWATPLARAFLLAAVVYLLFYAPRAGEGGGPGLFRPSTWPAAFRAATVGAFRAFWGVRVDTRADHQLVPFLAENAAVLAVTALPLLGLGLVGFLLDRYGERSRPVVSFATYWGGLGLFAFPVAAEVSAPWVAVHSAAPLAVPAAVGGAALLRYAARAGRERDAADVAVAALLLLAVVTHVGAAAATAYGPSTGENALAQYAQPADDLDPMLRQAAPKVERNRGVDVLYVGPELAVGDESAVRSPPVPDAFGARYPLPWYFERMDARTDSATGVDGLPADPPPVVVAETRYREVLAAQDGLSDYEMYRYRLGLTNREVVVFVAE